jgi:hypothetical protein
MSFQHNNVLGLNVVYNLVTLFLCLTDYHQCLIFGALANGDADVVYALNETLLL